MTWHFGSALGWLNACTSLMKPGNDDDDDDFDNDNDDDDDDDDGGDYDNENVHDLIW